MKRFFLFTPFFDVLISSNSYILRLSEIQNFISYNKSDLIQFNLVYMFCVISCRIVLLKSRGGGGKRVLNLI